ncbi:DNA-directed DNA polymerase [Tanacetum coccineum]
MTNKIDTVLKAITDRMAGALPSDTIPNAHLTPPLQSMLSKHVPRRQAEEPKPTFEDEFQDLHLNLPILDVLAHAPIYNAMLDKYVESLELGKNGSSFIQGEVPAKIEDPRLFTLPCRLGDSKPFDTLAYLGSCVNIILLYLFKKLSIRLLEETDHIYGLADGTKSYPVGIVKDVEVHIGKLKLLNDFYVIDMKKDPETPLLDSKHVIQNPIDWNKPPKNGDGALHAKIRLIDPDGEEFTKPCNQYPSLESSSKENAQGKSSTWTTSTTPRRVTSSLATRLINKEKRFLGGNPMFIFLAY